ncbi:immunoglobulin-like domain-containing protein [Enterococcus sp. BWR-S5]|uniref:immunoglobulin-like domain-containing protein n=1 Tax=Enterococcus sp. BWR-S5 TaxID=2787714 RepID=UPI0019216136|nr:immunoglobulin-like domain-containing protein [Enterococcus sp. BWR-S5]MBL1227216.1 DUF5011 domain-containing protein [Enterococcus sp. BWR-S5]
MTTKVTKKQALVASFVTLVCASAIAFTQCNNISGKENDPTVSSSSGSEKKTTSSVEPEKGKKEKEKSSKEVITDKERKKIDQIISNSTTLGEYTTERLGLSDSNHVTRVLNQDISSILPKPAVSNTPTTPVPETPVQNNPPAPENPLPELPTPPVQSTPQIILAASEIVIGQGTAFSAFNYFTVADSGDSAPKASVTEIDTFVLGWQTVNIYVQNKFGNTATAVLRVFVNAFPQITVSNSHVEIPMGSNVNLLDYVSATDFEDGDISGYIAVDSGGFTTSKEGEFVVTYYVKDSLQFSAIPKQITFHVTNAAPEIIAKDIEIEIDQPFNPLEHARVYDREGENIELTTENILENTVDVTSEGTYTVKYGNVKDSQGKAAADVSIKVKVVNEAPKISAPEFTLHIGDSFDKEAYKKTINVTDREDDKNGKDIEITFDEAALNLVSTTEEKEFSISIKAVDSHGKETTITGTIKIINDKPTITGVEDTEISVGDNFNPLAGVTATDYEDGDIPVTSITVGGTVNSNIPGEYTLTYSVVDSHGKKSDTYTRKVTVKALDSKILSSPVPFITNETKQSPTNEYVEKIGTVETSEERKEEDSTTMNSEKKEETDETTERIEEHEKN